VTFLNVATDGLPSGLRIPGGLSHPGAQHAGIHADGWAEQNARVALSSGDDATLVVRGFVPDAIRDQTLEVVVNGTSIFTGPLLPGPFDIRARAPATGEARQVELRWGNACTISHSDPRNAAALLTFVGVATGGAPTAIRRFPTDVADPNVKHNGIYPDGWLEGRAEITLAGGNAGELVLRAQAPPSLDQQQLEVRVDGVTVASAEAEDGAINLRAPLAATANDRHVRLTWSRTAVLSTSDTRTVGAHLILLAIASGRPPNAVARFPSDLMDPNLVSFGLYGDGWSEQQATVVLGGESEADLVVKAQLSPSLAAQSLDLEVDGRHLVSVEATRGVVNVRAPLPNSDSARRIVLNWGAVAAISERDRRRAAALIDMIAILPRDRG